MRLLTGAFALLVVACGSATEAPEAASGGHSGIGGAGGAEAAPAPTQSTFGGDRPVELHVPDDYDHGTATPLLILVHGYSASGTMQNLYWGLEAHALQRGFLYAYPDGTVDGGGNRFWNATDACCDFGKTGVDDASYLRALVDEIRGVYNVDDRRIYFTGHSNGSFMSHRMACDHADIVAGIAGLAGAMWLDESNCNPSEPVHVLQIHGDQDDVIEYGGGATGMGLYPSAEASAGYWAGHAGCSVTTTMGEPIDIDEAVAGAETTVTRYEDGCTSSVELWTIQGGAHVRAIGESFMPLMLDFLLANPKPE